MCVSNETITLFFKIFLLSRCKEIPFFPFQIIGDNILSVSMNHKNALYYSLRNN